MTFLFDLNVVLNALVSVALAFSMLPGVAYLAVAITNLIKVFLGWFGRSIDNYSKQVAAWVSLVLFAVLVYFRLFNPELELVYLDHRAALLAESLVIITGFLAQLVLQKPIHEQTRDKLPVINASYSTAEKDSTLGKLEEKPTAQGE